ncbi:MAG: HEAT repeat domain-containing protein, partial [Gammaproteobacteria bacterium]|nr:HEAT repeat domain-containing protein [Gammaproteobacteria bacterium]
MAFLISMREDFALNLNAFKEYLPTTLFENYYRLEKLEIDAAKEAIEEPVKKVGFRYEEGLLDDLLKDLADQERESRIGTQKAVIPEHAPSFVEPPNVQIVCTQLWELEKGNPDQVIRTKIYNEQGGSKGFINSYFEGVISAFSPSEKNIASKAFDHLVTPHGTKMAYPVKDLSGLLRVDEHDLSDVLEKLEKARVLRSQSREGIIWYELYHDIFSGIIYQWNDAYKAKQRSKRLLMRTAIAVVALILIVAAYDILTNYTSYHLRLSSKAGISTQIELYRGKAKSWDIARLQRYAAETLYQRSQVEPDKWFSSKAVAEYEDLSLELIGYLPVVDRISAYWSAGEIDKALELAQKSIGKENKTRSRAVIDLLAGFHSQRVFDDILKPHLDSPENASIRTYMISELGAARFDGMFEILIRLLTDSSETVRSRAASALGQIGDARAVDGLLIALTDDTSDVRSRAASALRQIGDARAVDGLLIALTD